MDIKEWLEKKPDILAFDNDITAPIFGWKDRNDYYEKAACYHRIPSIKIPTFFMNAKDDPIIGKKAIDYEIFKKNENTVLGTTKRGGHLGYFESIFKSG